MDVINLKFKKIKDASLCEIYQSVRMRFAFLSKDDKQCNIFCLCRDFLHDIVRCTIQEKSMDLYDCTYDGKAGPKVDLDSMKMLVRVDTQNKTDDWDEKMEHGVALINHYGDMIGLEKTKVERLEHIDTTKTYWLFTGPKFWVSSPFFVSMFSFLIRMGDKKIKFKDNDELKEKYNEICEKKHKENDNDVEYLRSVKGKLDIIMKNYKVVINNKKFDKGYSANVSIDTFHNQGGIVSLAKCNSFSKNKNARMKALFEGGPK